MQQFCNFRASEQLHTKGHWQQKGDAHTGHMYHKRFCYFWAVRKVSYERVSATKESCTHTGVAHKQAQGFCYIRAPEQLRARASATEGSCTTYEGMRNTIPSSLPFQSFCCNVFICCRILIFNICQMATGFVLAWTWCHAAPSSFFSSCVLDSSCWFTRISFLQPRGDVTKPRPHPGGTPRRTASCSPRRTVQTGGCLFLSLQESGPPHLCGRGLCLTEPP